MCRLSYHGANITVLSLLTRRSRKPLMMRKMKQTILSSEKNIISMRSS